MRHPTAARWAPTVLFEHYWQICTDAVAVAYLWALRFIATVKQAVTNLVDTLRPRMFDYLFKNFERKTWERIVVAIYGKDGIDLMYEHRAKKFKKHVATFESNGATTLPGCVFVPVQYRITAGFDKVATVFTTIPAGHSDDAQDNDPITPQRGTSPVVSETSTTETVRPPDIEATQQPAVPEQPEYDWDLYHLGCHPSDSPPPSISQLPPLVPSTSIDSSSTVELGNAYASSGASLVQTHSTPITAPGSYFMSFDVQPPGPNEPLRKSKSFASLAPDANSAFTKNPIDYVKNFSEDPEWKRRQERLRRIERGEESGYDDWVGRRKPRKSPFEVVDQGLPVKDVWELWNEKERHDYLFHTTAHETYTTKNGTKVVKGFKVKPRPVATHSAAVSATQPEALPVVMPVAQPASTKPAARRLSVLSQGMRAASMSKVEHKVRFTAETKFDPVPEVKIDHPHEGSWLPPVGLPSDFYGSAPRKSEGFFDVIDTQRAKAMTVGTPSGGYLSRSMVEAKDMTEAREGNGKAPAIDFKRVEIVDPAQSESAIASEDEEDGEDAWESMETTPANSVPVPVVNKPVLTMVPSELATKKRTSSNIRPRGILKNARAPVVPVPIATPPQAEEATYKLTPSKPADHGESKPKLPETPKSMGAKSPEVVDLEAFPAIPATMAAKPTGKKRRDSISMELIELAE